MTLAQRIKNNAGLRAILGNISWMSSDRFIRLFGEVLVSTAVARYLGPSRFGLLNYGLAFYALFNVISGLGLDFLVVRDVALKKEQEPKILGTAFVLKGVASVITTTLAIVAARLWEPHDKALLEIVAIMSIAAITQAFDVIDYFFQSRVQARYVVMARGSVFVGASVARLAAVFLHAPLMAFVWIGAAQIVLSEAALGYWYVRVRRPIPRWELHIDSGRKLLAEGWPLLISALMIMVYVRMDQVLLGKLTTKAVVGQYTAAVRLSEIWYNIPGVICASVMPSLVKAQEANIEKYYARMQRLYEAMALLGVTASLAVQLAGHWVVRILFGAQYAPAASILSIHIWTGLFVAVGMAGSLQIIQEKMTYIAMYRSAAGAIVNVILNLILIPRWGGIGSAVATLTAQLVAGYLADAFTPKTRHIFRMKTRAYLGFWLLPLRILRAEAALLRQ